MKKTKRKNVFIIFGIIIVLIISGVMVEEYISNALRT